MNKKVGYYALACVLVYVCDYAAHSLFYKIAESVFLPSGILRLLGFISLFLVSIIVLNVMRIKVNYFAVFLVAFLNVMFFEIVPPVFFRYGSVEALNSSFISVVLRVIGIAFHCAAVLVNIPSKRQTVK